MNGRKFLKTHEKLRKGAAERFLVLPGKARRDYHAGLIRFIAF